MKGHLFVHAILAARSNYLEVPTNRHWVITSGCGPRLCRMTVGPLQGGAVQPQAVLLQLQSLGHDGMRHLQQVFVCPDR